MRWAQADFGTADLGDARPKQRPIKVAGQLATTPLASTPTTCGSWGETVATCRLLDNERRDWREIIEAHSDWPWRVLARRHVSADVRPRLLSRVAMRALAQPGQGAQQFERTAGR